MQVANACLRNPIMFENKLNGLFRVRFYVFIFILEADTDLQTILTRTLGHLVLELLIFLLIII